jgi:hypothetical protein
MAEEKTSRHASVIIGMIPVMSGAVIFSIGMAAILEIMIVVTSSEGWSSPICRLPIKRKTKITIKYKMSVRNKRDNQ